MDDLDENGAMVNALQRRADVVVQKSIAEGFGLTVAEGMWKDGRWSPAGSAASRTRSSTARAGCWSTTRTTSRRSAGRSRSLLEDPERAARLGGAARRRVMERFLGIGRLTEYVELVASLTSR